MKHNLIETIMGGVVLCVAAFFLSFAYLSSNVETTDGTQLLARFDRVDGVQVGTDVRLSGVKVGSVNAVRIDPATFLVEVTMSVDANLALPKDSSAEIISSGLLGSKYVAVVPGGEEDTLKSGDEITYTQSAISLEAMIGQLIFNSKDSDKGETKE